MKIGIDASRYKFSTATGVEWYSYHLLNHLLPILGREHNSQIILYTREKQDFEEENPFNVSQKVLKAKKLWTLRKLSLEMLFHPVDVLFIPSHIPPIILPKKLVVTIHDLAFKHKDLDGVYSLFERLLLDYSTKRSVRKAYRIIVPSEATKKDLIDFYNCDENKIRVIPHGSPVFDENTNPMVKQWKTSETKSFLKKFNLSENDLLVLFVGRIESKKNLVRLLEAFKRFLGEYPDWKLVLAGKSGFGFDEIIKKIQELKIQAQVIVTGYISEKEKHFLLNKCRIFAMPSLLEGFGLPILEAYAFGRPVITSNVSSMPEIAGKGSLLVNPKIVAEISVALKRLASDGVLVSTLVNEGKKQLENFCWEKSAEMTYQTLIE